MTIDRHHGDDPADHRPDTLTPVLLGDMETLLTAVPYLLGFHPPADNLVVVGLRDRMLTILLVRDIPTATDLVTPDDVRAVWRHTAHVLTRHGCDSVVLIAYAGPGRIDDLHHLLDAIPLPVEEAVRVDQDRWWAIDCPHPGRCTHPACTPAGQRLTDDLKVTSTMAATGHAVPGTRADLAHILRPGPADILHDVAARLPLDPAPTREDLFTALTRAHDARTVRPRPIPADHAAVLLHGLTDVIVRDACLAWDDDAAWWLFTDLIRTAPPGWIAPVATVLALLAYQRGDGVTAAIAAEHALLDRPGYPLALLVRGLLDIATTPAQVRAVITEALTQLPPGLRPTTTG